jgi:phospholipid-translocating ATPase
VLFVTTVREAIDDFRRAQRDKEINCRLYKKLVPSGFELIPSSKIKVGDLIFVDKGIYKELYVNIIFKGVYT